MLSHSMKSVHIPVITTILNDEHRNQNKTTLILLSVHQHRTHLIQWMYFLSYGYMVILVGKIPEKAACKRCIFDNMALYFDC